MDNTGGEGGLGLGVGLFSKMNSLIKTVSKRMMRD